MIENLVLLESYFFTFLKEKKNFYYYLTIKIELKL